MNSCYSGGEENDIASTGKSLTLYMDNKCAEFVVEMVVGALSVSYTCCSFNVYKEQGRRKQLVEMVVGALSVSYTLFI